MCPRGTSAQNTVLLRSPPAGSTSSACHGQKQTGGRNRLPPATFTAIRPAGPEHHGCELLMLLHKVPAWPSLTFGGTTMAHAWAAERLAANTTRSSLRLQRDIRFLSQSLQEEGARSPVGPRNRLGVKQPEQDWRPLLKANLAWQHRAATPHAPPLTLEGAVICSRISRGRRVTSGRQALGSATRSPNMGPSPSKQSQEGGAVRCGLPAAEACALASGEVGRSSSRHRDLCPSTCPSTCKALEARWA